MTDEVSAGTPNNLPLQVTSFVGRVREQAEVLRLLGQTRVLTLTGSGGSGKTRLAIEAAGRSLDLHPHGVWWVDLAGLTDPELLPATVATAVGVQEQPGGSLVQTLVHSLSDRRLLLVVDNCEHLVEACAMLVAALVHGCPGVTVLATSREPLGVDGETSLRVPSLAVPSERPSSPHDIAAVDAAVLFAERARQVRPNFRITDDNAATVAQICRRLDGIPLAIELAAARVRLLTPAQIADGLSDRFRLLTGGPRTALPRQRTLEASVEWSYELLDGTERLVLSRLAVFAGTFSLDGAEAVCADESIEAYAVLDVLSALVDRSLVQVEESTGQARYRLLETIRVYARQRLAELDDPAQVRDRHLDFYVTLAHEGGAGLATDFDRWLVALGAELDNFRAAMEWAMASSRPLAVVQVVDPTFTFWIVRGLYSEMHRRLKEALAAAALEPLERARGLTAASILALMGGDYPAGFEFADAALALADEHDDREVIARSYLYRAWTGFFSGRGSDEEIWADLKAALGIIDELDDPELLARGLMYAGVLRMNGRSVSAGREQLEQALTVMDAATLPHLRVPTQTFLAYGVWWDGRVEDARQHAAQALQLGRPIDYHAFVSLTLSALATAEALAGNESLARGHIDEARKVARRAGLPAFDMYALRTLAFTEYCFGDPDAARGAADRALASARTIMGGMEEAAASWIAGAAALRAGDHDGAREHFETARDGARDPRYPFVVGRSQLGLAYVATLDENHEEAWELAHEALEALADWGDPMGTADVLEVVAGLAVRTGGADRAARLLGAADRLRQEVGVGRWPLEAERHPAYVAAARSTLGDEEFDRCWTEGVALSGEDAVAYARRGRGERGRPAIGWQSLTPAEVEVVRLVASGISNADIAEQLFVSPNTVKTHLSHVYTKLDLSSRSELAAQAARRDL